MSHTPTEHVAGTIAALELLPCPFCGSDRITVWNIRDGVQVVCKDCKATGTPTYLGRDGVVGSVRDAKKAWNTRAILPAQGQDDPVACIRFDKATDPNEMPKVISCNWQPDGVYRVYLHPTPAVSLPEDVAGRNGVYGSVILHGEARRIAGELQDTIEAQAAEIARRDSVITDALGRYQVSHIHEGLRAALSPADSKEGE